MPATEFLTDQFEANRSQMEDDKYESTEGTCGCGGND